MLYECNINEGDNVCFNEGNKSKKYKRGLTWVALLRIIITEQKEV